MQKMLKVRPGMTRAELRKVFTTEGGIWVPLRLTFVAKDCPYFKVDVEFRMATGSGISDSGVDVAERESDIIVKISRPYLEFSVTD